MLSDALYRRRNTLVKFRHESDVSRHIRGIDRMRKLPCRTIRHRIRRKVIKGQFGIVRGLLGVDRGKGIIANGKIALAMLKKDDIFADQRKRFRAVRAPVFDDILHAERRIGKRRLNADRAFFKMKRFLSHDIFQMQSDLA